MNLCSWCSYLNSLKSFGRGRAARHLNLGFKIVSSRHDLGGHLKKLEGMVGDYFCWNLNVRVIDYIVNK